MPLLSIPIQTNAHSLSKITITSNRATCQKDKTQPQLFIFNYQDNVVVTFADKSTITANQLEVIFEGKDLGKKLIHDHKITSTAIQAPLSKQNPLEKFKKITAVGNVTLVNQNRTARAQRVELQLAQHLCTLIGNVTIAQKKTTLKEIPITIESDQATLNLQTDELAFAGSESKPVNTTISLDDYEPLHKKSKNSKRKKK